MYTFSDCQARQSSRLLAQTYYQRADPRILAILFHRYRGSIFRLCCTYLKDRMEAEDATMDIFEMLPVHLGKYRIRNFYSWLMRFSRNYCLERLKQRPRWPAAYGFYLVRDDQPPGAKLRLEEKIEQLYRGLDQLKNKQRECIMGYYFERLSYKEIARELQLSPKAVKSHIQNGKRNLRIFLLQTAS